MTSAKFKIVTLEQEKALEQESTPNNDTSVELSYIDSLHPEILRSLILNQKISKNTFDEAYTIQERITFSCKSGISNSLSALINKKVS